MNTNIEAHLLEYYQATELNAMQKSSQELYKTHQNIAIQAPTGSGKTLAFLLPTLAKIDTSIVQMQVVIFVPSKELVAQIDTILTTILAGTDITHKKLISGANVVRQIDTLKVKPHVLVAQIDQLDKILQKKKLKFTQVTDVIIDEADSFFSQKSYTLLQTFFTRLSNTCKKSLFSATYIPEVQERIESIMPGMHYANFSQGDIFEEVGTNDYLLETEVPFKHGEVLAKKLKELSPTRCLIFTHKNGSVGEIRFELEKRNIFPSALNGNTSNTDRKLIMRDFLQANAEEMEWHPHIMITTDTLARGIDISDVDLIVNYRLPFDEVSFTHRVGRTGRYNETGTVLTIISPKETKTYKDWLANYQSQK